VFGFDYEEAEDDGGTPFGKDFGSQIKTGF
jgi:hypothetical protein